jgi:LmbE family N-acetylglucosaminyl deacetylase
MKPEKLAKIREQEQLAAAKVLGVKEVVFLHYQDQALEDTADFRKEIVRQIRKYRPEIVLASDPYRRYLWHRDHRITGQVTLDAVFPYARDHLAYPDLLEQGFEPHKVKEVLMWGTEEPNYRSDITATFSIKLAALRCHRSQIEDAMVPKLEERLRQWAKEMAKGESFELAEAFHRTEVWW